MPKRYAKISLKVFHLSCRKEKSLFILFYNLISLLQERVELLGSNHQLPSSSSKDSSNRMAYNSKLMIKK